jgi:hypothetical protein
MWIEWEELWAKILAQNKGRGTANGRGEEMRFFASLRNMVLKYRYRSNSACLTGRTSALRWEHPLLLIVFSMALSSLKSHFRRLDGSK